MKTSTICAAALLTSSIAAAQDQPAFPIDLSQGSHIQEFMISVSDMKRTLPTFTDVMKWKIFDLGKADAASIIGRQPECINKGKCSDYRRGWPRWVCAFAEILP